MSLHECMNRATLFSKTLLHLQLMQRKPHLCGNSRDGNHIFGELGSLDIQRLFRLNPEPQLHSPDSRIDRSATCGDSTPWLWGIAIRHSLLSPHSGFYQNISRVGQNSLCDLHLECSRREGFFAAKSYQDEVTRITIASCEETCKLSISCRHAVANFRKVRLQHQSLQNTISSLQHSATRTSRLEEALGGNAQASTRIDGLLAAITARACLRSFDRTVLAAGCHVYADFAVESFAAHKHSWANAIHLPIICFYQVKLFYFL